MADVIIKINNPNCPSNIPDGWVSIDGGVTWNPPQG